MAESVKFSAIVWNHAKS